MILPVIAYGHPVLKKIALDIDKDYKDLSTLLENMWETMYHASGVGLAAPQIGLSIRIFLVDTIQALEDEGNKEGIKKVFINARILEEDGKPWEYEEGCLSIPHIKGMVERPQNLVIEYMDEDFNIHKESYSGINARVIQHEYDHIEGLLFTEKLKPLKRRMIKRKLEAIKKGKVQSDYRLKFYNL